MPRDAKRTAKPPPPKPYEGSTPIKATTLTKGAPIHPVLALPQSGTDIWSPSVKKEEKVEKEEEEDEEEEEEYIEGYSYVFMNPKDPNKPDAASIVNEIRKENKQYLASLSIDQVH